MLKEGAHTSNGTQNVNLLFCSFPTWLMNLPQELLFWHCLSFFLASLAQLVEQLICNQQVAGSSPTAGST